MTSTDFCIRPMNIEDLTHIMEIEKRVFKLPFTLSIYQKDFLENPYSHYYVLELKDTIVGFFGIWLIYENAQIVTVAVDRQLQGQGYGNLIINSILEIVEKNDVQAITLEVRISNQKAIALYEKYGFIKAAIRKNYYRDGEDAHLMLKSYE